ncbi:hypothetical protein BBJ28_00011742 [Nothophytophthora sp. Chile5]|nr:hypothetical protein BBJ28_00011742 [Nothophytophthora sp. Chile5]
MTDAALAPSPPRPAGGVQDLHAEKAAAALRSLMSVSSDQLAASNDAEQERVAIALNGALTWLHTQISSPPGATDLHMLSEFSAVFNRWHAAHEKRPLRLQLWLMWLELGCSLEVLRSYRSNLAAAMEPNELSRLLVTSRPPEGFPMASAHCNKAAQIAYSCDLWDAVVAKPLQGGAIVDVTARLPWLMDVFLYWMANAMRGYEVAFLANVGVTFSAHLRASSASYPGTWSFPDAMCAFAKLQMTPLAIDEHAASVAVTVMSLSAVTRTQRTSEGEKYLAMLRDEMIDRLVRSSFPGLHSSTAIVTMALGLAALEEARVSDVQTSRKPQFLLGKETLLQQFALLRLVNFPLLSSRLSPCEETVKSAYQAAVHRGLNDLALDSSASILLDLSLRMTEACVEEMVAFFQSSKATHRSLLLALRSVLPAELFHSQVLKQYVASTGDQMQDDGVLSSAPEVLAFLKHFFGAVAPILKSLSTTHLARAFLTLSRLEFAREACASPTSNGSMNAVTQQLEQALEQPSSPPEALLSTIFRSIAMHSMAMKSFAIPREVDIVSGCQTLAVGLIIQRKLRVLLFQCPTLVDDALAVVFSGLYNVYEPLDTFAHRFLGVCLTHLAQFVPLFTVFPHYLQVTLAAYPANASQQTLAKVCGTIFGALFYSDAVDSSAIRSNGQGETTAAHQLVLWAIRKCCERSTTLLLAEQQEAAKTSTKTEVTKVEADAKTSDNKSVGASEADGLYLAGLVFELMKMTPIDLLEASAMEAERLLVRWKSDNRVLRDLKRTLFGRISQNCEAEKRVWLAAWYIEIDKRYPIIEATTSAPAAMAQPSPSRL